MNNQTYMCNCIGPQNGEPLCPCRMRNVKIRNGRYVEIIDHGPVTKITSDDIMKSFEKNANLG